MKIKREGEPEDPVEGSNVTLLCDFRGYEYPYSPNWFYLNSSGDYHQINFANKSFKKDAKLNKIIKIYEQPTKGLTLNHPILSQNLLNDILLPFCFKMNADIHIETEGFYDISQDFFVYNTTLYLKNVTLDTPYTKFKCQINETAKEISFKVKGKRKRRLMPLEYLEVYTESNELFSSVNRNKQRASEKYNCTRKRNRPEFDLQSMVPICSYSMAQGESFLILRRILSHY